MSANAGRLAGPPGQPRATVVVPTRDRPEALAECLAALARQTLPNLDVVVVDDGSRRSAAVDAVVAPSVARLVRLDGRGPAAARNAGAETAATDSVLFCDDDCAPRDDWAARLVAALSSGTKAVAGRTDNGLVCSALASASHAVLEGVVDAGLDPERGTLSFAPTCNLGVNAEVLAAIPFDESYPLAAGEDRDWGARLAAAGIGIAPVPDAVVIHRHPLSPGGFWRQHEGYGRGAARFRRGHGNAAKIPGLRRAVLARGRAAGPRVAGLVAVAQIATAAGLVRETIAMRSE